MQVVVPAAKSTPQPVVAAPAPVQVIEPVKPVTAEPKAAPVTAGKPPVAEEQAAIFCHRKNIFVLLWI